MTALTSTAIRALRHRFGDLTDSIMELRDGGYVVRPECDLFAVNKEIVDADGLQRLTNELRERRDAAKHRLMRRKQKTAAATGEVGMNDTLADERFREIERARQIIAGLTAYRESLLTCPLSMEAYGRHRIRELSTPPQDDHDRAVLMVLDDIERLIKAIAAPVSLK